MIYDSFLYNKINKFVNNSTDKGILLINPYLRGETDRYYPIMGPLCEQYNIDMITINKDVELNEDELKLVLKFVAEYKFVVISGKGTAVSILSDAVQSVSMTLLKKGMEYSDDVFRLPLSHLVDNRVERVVFIDSTSYSIYQNKNDEVESAIKRVYTELNNIQTELIDVKEKRIMSSDDFLANFDGWLSYFKGHDAVGFDYESSDLSYRYNSWLTGVGLSTDDLGIFVHFPIIKEEAIEAYKRFTDKWKVFCDEVFKKLWCYNLSMELNYTNYLMRHEYEFNDAYVLCKMKQLPGGLKVNAVTILGVPQWKEENEEVMIAYDRIWAFLESKLLFVKDNIDANNRNTPYAQETSMILKDFSDRDIVNEAFFKPVLTELTYLSKWYKPSELYYFIANKYSGWAIIPRDILGEYCIKDSFYTLKIFRELSKPEYRLMESYPVYRGNSFIGGIIEGRGLYADYDYCLRQKRYHEDTIDYHYLDIINHPIIKKKLLDKFIEHKTNEVVASECIPQYIKETYGITKVYKYIISFILDDGNSDDRAIGLFYDALCDVNPKFLEDKSLFINNLPTIKSNIRSGSKELFNIKDHYDTWESNFNELLSSVKTMNDGKGFYNPNSNDPYHTSLLWSTIMGLADYENFVPLRFVVTLLGKIAPDEEIWFWTTPTAQEKIDYIANIVKNAIDGLDGIEAKCLSLYNKLLIPEYQGLVDNLYKISKINIWDTIRKASKSKKPLNVIKNIDYMKNPDTTDLFNYRAYDAWINWLDSQEEIIYIRDNIANIDNWTSIISGYNNGVAQYEELKINGNNKGYLATAWECYVHFMADSADADAKDNPERYNDSTRLLYDLVMIKRLNKTKGTYLEGKSGVESMSLISEEDTKNLFTSPNRIGYAEPYYKAEAPLPEGTRVLVNTSIFMNSKDSLRSASGFHTLPSKSSITDMFTTRSKDSILIGADLAQNEVRVLSGAVNAITMQEALRNGFDIHEANARAMYQVPEGEKVDPLYRSYAKLLSFSILYGKGIKAIADDYFGGHIQRAQETMDKFLGANPEIQDFIKNNQALASDSGIVDMLLYNHPIRVGVPGDNKTVRTAVNLPIQGASSTMAAYGFYLSYQMCQMNNIDVAPLMFTHDAMYEEVPIIYMFDAMDIIKVGLIDYNYDKYNIIGGTDYECGLVWKMKKGLTYNRRDDGYIDFKYKVVYFDGNEEVLDRFERLLPEFSYKVIKDETEVIYPVSTTMWGNSSSPHMGKAIRIVSIEATCKDPRIHYGLPPLNKNYNDIPSVKERW